MWTVWRLETKINSGLKQNNVPQGWARSSTKTGLDGQFLASNNAQLVVRLVATLVDHLLSYLEP